MMRAPSNETACRVLFLQAADEGRGPLLFGADADRACEKVLPFVKGVPFPTLYLEFPLLGDPFLDVTVLEGKIPAGTRFDTPAAAGTERMIDWYAGVRQAEGPGKHEGICFGFEVDTKAPDGTRAAVHFQHYSRIGLAGAFCEALGEAEAGQRYMEKASRMPEGWPLAFFGFFRGRAGAPLRICGYMAREEKNRIAEDPARLKQAFGQIGFTAWDEAMLNRVSELLRLAPESVDFQFDLLPDGTMGGTFAIDVCFGIRRTEEVSASFRDGPAARLMKTLEAWGAADDRWQQAAGMAFTRGIPVEDEEGKNSDFGFILTPNWLKVRWRGGVLQPSKLYCVGEARIIKEDS